RETEAGYSPGGRAALGSHVRLPHPTSANNGPLAPRREPTRSSRSVSMRTTYCGLVTEKLMGQSVTLMGWAHRRRDHGGVIFIDLRDREGLVQIVCDPDRPEMFKTAEGVRHEFCLKV